jgi:hypothetical protein
MIIKSKGVNFLKHRKKHREEKHSTITITGQAGNEDGHAMVKGDNERCYLLWGMDEWGHEWEGKRIKVIGDLEAALHEGAGVIKDAVVQKIGYSNIKY